MSSSSPPEPDGPLFRVEGVEKSFGDVRALRGATFEVAPAGVTCLIGPPGAGKSTLLRCMNLLEPVDGGTIVLEGQDVTAGDRAESIWVRRRVGMVFQDLHLFQRTALGNVSLARRAAYGRSPEGAGEKGMSALEQVALAEQADVHVERLSPAQKVRLAVARALAIEPDVLLIDDVTRAGQAAPLDDLLGVVRGLASAGMPVVLATREADAARAVADRLAVMEDGVIVSEGEAEGP